MTDDAKLIADLKWFTPTYNARGRTVQVGPETFDKRMELMIAAASRLESLASEVAELKAEIDNLETHGKRVFDQYKIRDEESVELRVELTRLRATLDSVRAQVVELGSLMIGTRRVVDGPGAPWPPGIDYNEQITLHASLENIHDELFALLSDFACAQSAPASSVGVGEDKPSPEAKPERFTDMTAQEVVAEYGREGRREGEALGFGLHAPLCPSERPPMTPSSPTTKKQGDAHA